MLKPQNASHVTYYMALELSFHFNLFYSTHSLQELDGKQRHGSVAVWRLQRLPSVTSYPKQVGTPGASNGCSVGRIMKNHENTFGKNILTLGWCSVAFFGLCTSSISSLQPLPSCLGGRGDSWKNLATLRCARSISKEMAGLFVLRLAGQRALLVGMSRWCKQGKPKVEPSSNQPNLQPLHELGWQHRIQWY